MRHISNWQTTTVMMIVRALLLMMVTVIIGMNGQEKSDSNLCTLPRIYGAYRTFKPNKSLIVYSEAYYWVVTVESPTSLKPSEPLRMRQIILDHGQNKPSRILFEVSDGAVRKVVDDQLFTIRLPEDPSAADDNVDPEFDTTALFPRNGFSTGYTDEQLTNRTQPNPEKPNGPAIEKQYYIYLTTDRVYYFDNFYQPIDGNNNSQGYVGGHYGENFPHKLTAILAYEGADFRPGHYAMFLFRGDKYCHRYIDEPQACQDGSQGWLSANALFGCKTVGSESTDSPGGGGGGTVSHGGGTDSHGAENGADATTSSNSAPAPIVAGLPYELAILTLVFVVNIILLAF